MVNKVNPRYDKNGNPWLIIEAEDFEGHVELKVWPRNYEKVSPLLEPGGLIAFTGRVNHWKGANQIEVTSAKPVEEVRSASTRTIRIEWSASQLTEAGLTALQSLAAAHRGRKPIELVLRHEQAGLVRFQFERPMKIHLTDDCIEALQALPGAPKIRFTTDRY